MAVTLTGCGPADVRNCKTFSDRSGIPKLSADYINRSGQTIKALDISVTSANFDGGDGLGLSFEVKNVKAGSWIHDSAIGLRAVPQQNYAPAGQMRQISICVADAVQFADGKLEILYSPP